MAWHALSLLINQLYAFMRSAMQICVMAVVPFLWISLGAKFL